MTQKLNCILLIDDDELTNLINKMILKKLDCAEKILVFKSGKEALNYLESNEPTEYPNLIFLDINMPAMNGWEFMEKYKTIQKQELDQTVVIILTTSLDPKEHEKADHTKKVNGFKNKPLTPETVQEIVSKHFKHQGNNVDI
jgi:CheY-like chemotaxis protein